LLFGEGYEASPGVKFLSQIRNLGDGRQDGESCGEGSTQTEFTVTMAKIGDQSGNDDDNPYDRRYAAAAEVDGLRSTMDTFMKQLMSYMS
jgi:hypothetical protein